jgi:anti-sigma B factor antagonist
MSFDIDRNDGAVVVRLNVARLDANTSQQLRLIIDNQEIQSDDHVVLDFEGVDFIDSSGLGVLVKLMKHLGKSGEMVLCSIHSKPIMDILYMTRLYKSFNIQDSLEKALAAFQTV